MVEDDKLRSLSDYNLLKFAKKDDRVFLALDKDFKCDESLYNIISQCPGVILVRSSDPISDQVKKIILKWLDGFSKRTLRGKLWVISIDKKEIIDLSK